MNGEYPLTPDAELAYDRTRREVPTEFPDRCIICYQPFIRNWAVERLRAECIETMLGCNLYRFEYKSKSVAIIQSGIGAPMAVLLLERLIARGMK